MITAPDCSLAPVADGSQAAGFRAVELMATLPGEPLYRALGFAEVERTEALLPDGERLPMVRMSRALPLPVSPPRAPSRS